MSMHKVHPNDLAPEHEPDPPQEIAIPAGTRFYQLSVVAESWDEWDRLTTTLFTTLFSLRQWWVDGDSNRVEPDVPGARFHQHLEVEHEGGRVTVYPPAFERPVAALPEGLTAEDFDTGIAPNGDGADLAF